MVYGRPYVLFSLVIIGQDLHRQFTDHGVDCCHVCGSKKMWGRKRRAHLKQYGVGAPMKRIAVDILGPLPETSRKNKFILVVSDFSQNGQRATQYQILLLRSW